MADALDISDELVATIKNAGGIILAVTEDRNWIEVFFEGDTMHTRTINLPSGRLFDIYVEGITHKATLYEHPRTMIFFTGPCDLEITRDGDRVIVTGTPSASDHLA
jgi:hypothetical protein